MFRKILEMIKKKTAFARGFLSLKRSLPAELEIWSIDCTGL